MSRYGTRFIGVVKTATRNYPMSYLQSVELNQRGNGKGLISFGVLSGDPTMLAFVWMDRQRRYFIATASSLGAGTPYTRWCWRQVDPIDTNADPTNLQLLVPQPRATELYYSACGIIDRHSRARQDTLRLEAKLETHVWSWCVNMTILGIIVVDTWLVYSQCTETQMCQKDFYTQLAEDLIENTYDMVHYGVRRNGAGEHQEGQLRSSPTLFERQSGDPRAGCFAHLTPTKKEESAWGGYFILLPSRVCKKGKTTFVCSVCRDENPDNEVWLCCSHKEGKTVLCNSHD